MLPSSIQQVDAYNCISMETLSWHTELAASILQRIQVSLSGFKHCYFQCRVLFFNFLMIINFHFDCRLQIPNFLSLFLGLEFLTASPISWQDLH